MPRHLLLAGTALMAVLLAGQANAQTRYAEPPPLAVSPDMSAPWVMQLQRAPAGRRVAAPVEQRRIVTRSKVRTPVQVQGQVQGQPRGQVRVQRRQTAPNVRTVSVTPPPAKRLAMNPVFLPRDVAYETSEKPGTIVIDTANKFLYHVQANGQARRYGVGVGKEGMAWSGTEIVTNKRQWPSWHPPQEMRERERREKGRILPVMMPGGPENPLGARALYLGSTLYRIHGTNAPWTIGTSNSSGCIRMRNEDVVDLYEKVTVGTKVVVM